MSFHSFPHSVINTLSKVECDFFNLFINREVKAGAPFVMRCKYVLGMALGHCDGKQFVELTTRLHCTTHRFALDV